MVFDILYKISVFGDFLDIEPTPENMVDMIEKFKDYGMIPSVFQEMSLEVDYINNTQKNEQLQRLSLVSKDNKERLLISSNRIDFEIMPSDDKAWSDEKLSEHNKKISDSFRILLEYFKKTSNRLALNSNTIITNIEEKQFKDIFDSFSKPIGIYNDKSLKKWSTYFVAMKEIVIGGKENLNIITEINEAKEIKNIGQNIYSKGFLVNIDINTAPENTDSRFQSGSIGTFIGISNKIKADIIKDIKKAGDLI